MLAPLRILDQLRARLHDTLGLIPAGEDRGLVSLILELPRPLARPPDLAGPRFQFVHTHRDEIRAGYGLAAEWRAEGPERLPRLGASVRRMAADWRQFDPDETGFAAFGMFGFAAVHSEPSGPGAASEPPELPAHGVDAEIPDAGLPPEDLPDALFWVPELALHSRDGQAALILSAALPVDPAELAARWEARLEDLVPWLDRPALDPLTPAPLDRGESRPDPEAWRRLVAEALAAIARGPLEKVVLCRRLRLEGRRHFDIARLVAALAYLFPSCQAIEIRRRETSFVAATPERLFTQTRDRVEVDAIAGTVRRAANAERDAELTAALLGSEKDLREHRVVVEAVTEALLPCGQVDPPEGPRVLRLNNAQHLWSLVRAELRPGQDVFALAARLHPTPATNGQPGPAARDWLRAHEPIPRGWYTGCAGIVAPDLTGELWVLLRCARIRGRLAELHAGAGIVPGSDADAEWEETGHKLAAMFTALQFA